MMADYIRLLPCPRCGTPRAAEATSCPRADCDWRRHSKRTRPDLRTARHQRRSTEIRDEWVERFGPVCPGYHRPAHLVDPTDLTADHLADVATGGDPDGPMGVLCRSCNSRKGNDAKKEAYR